MITDGLGEHSAGPWWAHDALNRGSFRLGNEQWCLRATYPDAGRGGAFLQVLGNTSPSS